MPPRLKTPSPSPRSPASFPGVPNEPVSLTPGIAHFIGYSFTKWLEARRPAGVSGPVVVSVGRDPRISGPMMEAALVSGIAAAGGEVDTFGIATTPCMFYSIVESSECACMGGT
jgi:phosphomannomutase